jgi:hypothetical protein
MLHTYEDILENKYINLDIQISYRNYIINEKESLKYKLKDLYLENINFDYIDIILSDKKNKIICHNIDNYYNKKNITSILIYQMSIFNGEIIYYIFLLGTHVYFRNLGYGKIILDEFIQKVKLEYLDYQKIIVLKSLIPNIEFYEFFGFIKLCDYDKYNLFDKYEEFTNETVLLELKL